MTQDSARCPQCDSLVEPNDTICLNCYFELRQNASDVPTRQPTRQQTPERPPSMHPDTRPDFPPGRRYSQSPSGYIPDEPYMSTEPVGPTGHVTNMSALSPKPSPRIEADDTSMKFRPKLRPPMAVITIFDDDGEDGE